MVDPLTELFLVPVSCPQRMWYVLSHLWDGECKIRKISLSGNSRFPFSLSEWSFTVNIMSVSLNKTYIQV